MADQPPTTPDLLPCPFCGGEAKVYRDQEPLSASLPFGVECQRWRNEPSAGPWTCPTTEGRYESEVEAIAVWNRRRAPHPGDAALVERIDEKLAYAAPAEHELTPLSQQLLALLRDLRAALDLLAEAQREIDELVSGKRRRCSAPNEKGRRKHCANYANGADGLYGVHRNKLATRAARASEEK